MLSIVKVNYEMYKAEAQKNLNSIYEAQQAYFKKEGKYANGENCFDLFKLAPNYTQYTYYCGSDKLPCEGFGKRRPCLDNCPEPPIQNITDDSFTILAIGNIDGDSVCDVWSINDAKELINITSDLD